jgi:hypothetical protein
MCAGVKGAETAAGRTSALFIYLLKKKLQEAQQQVERQCFFFSCFSCLLQEARALKQQQVERQRFLLNLDPGTWEQLAEEVNFF